MAQLNGLYTGGPLFIEPKDKITVSFTPSGSVTGTKIKYPKIKVAPDKPFSDLIKHIRTSLALKEDQAVYLYLQQSYIPEEDMVCHDLNLLCGNDGVITVHYALEPIWG